MIRTCIASLVVLLAACSAPAYRPVSTSPCAVSEASYECQVERYHNVNVN
jgi:hypothetical protein